MGIPWKGFSVNAARRIIRQQNQDSKMTSTSRIFLKPLSEVTMGTPRNNPVAAIMASGTFTACFCLSRMAISLISAFNSMISQECRRLFNFPQTLLFWGILTTRSRRYTKQQIHCLRKVLLLRFLRAGKSKSLCRQQNQSHSFRIVF